MEEKRRGRDQLQMSWEGICVYGVRRTALEGSGKSNTLLSIEEGSLELLSWQVPFAHSNSCG